MASGSPRGSQRDPGSQPGSPGRSRAGSVAGSRSGAKPGYPTPLGYDPAKPQGSTGEDRGNKRLDLPPEAYTSVQRLQNAGVQSFAKRPDSKPIGKPVKLEANQFRIMNWNDAAKIYQFDVSISPVPLKVGPVFKKLWEHPDVKNTLAKYKTLWLCDGKKLAWSTANMARGEERIHVDLDRDLPPRKDGKERRPNAFYMTIRTTTEINLGILDAYLRKQCDWSNKVLEAMNFMDHLVRQWPSEHMIAIKRNFYAHQPESSAIFNLGPGVDLVKGVYASVRMNQSVINGIGRGLGLNVDVANTAFWSGNMPIPTLIKNFMGMMDAKYKGMSIEALAKEVRPRLEVTTGGKKMYAMSPAFKILRKLSKINFVVTHRGKEHSTREYKILSFEFGEKYGPQGGTPKNVTIEYEGKEISIEEYFKKKYGYRVVCPDFPVILTAKAGVFPIDVATIAPMQRFPFKLGPDETANMIKGAVTRPDKRRADIMSSKKVLGWTEDPYLRQYGIQFDQNMTKIMGQLLPPPVVQFTGGQADPKYSGRWDLRGKKFIRPNSVPLMSWGVMILERAVQPEQAQAFGSTFKKVFSSHGGKVTADPVIITSQVQNANVAEAVKNGIEELRRKTNKPVQLLFCILKFQNANNYERLKKSADCRFAVLTQVVIAKHVFKNNDQYHSNVAMKVNAKLGGATSRVPGPNKSAASPFFKASSMIIGVDVSHAGPGMTTVPSMAAMTMSMDKDALRYAAAVQTNGYRVEMVTPINIKAFLGQLVPQWHRELGAQNPPQHIFYFRDGVAEGQFAQVLETEVKELKNWFRENRGGHVPKVTVIVATKRHHIRFFPAQGSGDKNGNMQPGTLVETDVCHPFHWDFYLCAHTALQGTARPVHYTVLVDEVALDPNMLKMMIYQHCYQYIRSTTSVSLHPAVYYADLAAGRARVHENHATSEGFRAGPKAAEMTAQAQAYEMSMGTPKHGSESLPLLGMGGPDSLEINRNFFKSTMWFI